jgi:hypothetical protein
VAEVRQPGGERPLEREPGVLTNQEVAEISERVQSNGAGSYPHPLSSAEYLGGEIKRHKRGMLLLLTPVLATAIIVSYFAYSRYLAGSSKAGTTSIAVLPFANETGDPNAEYLSEGISESLINSLSQGRRQSHRAQFRLQVQGHRR